VRIKTPLNKEEKLTVMLTVLNPEPVISKNRLEFTSRVNNEPLLSLFLAKPNPDEFNAFVSQLKQKALDEYNAFAGLKSGSTSELERNVYDEPPEFDNPDNAYSIRNREHINVEGIEDAIKMLSAQVDNEQIGSFLEALKGLKEDPMDESRMSRVVTEFASLGSAQGAVLTYAPYISVLLSDDPFKGL